MEELWFDGTPLKTSGPAIGQFLKYIESHSNLNDEEKKALAMSHLTGSAKKFVKYDVSKSWQDMRKNLFAKYQCKLPLKSKIELKKSLIQSEDESCRVFYERCVKCQYVIRDDIEDLVLDNDITISFVIGLYLPIYQQLLLNDGLNAPQDWLEAALKVEKEFLLGRHRIEPHVKLEVGNVKKEPVDDYQEENLEDHQEGFHDEAYYMEEEYQDDFGEPGEEENFAYLDDDTNGNYDESYQDQNIKGEMEDDDDDDDEDGDLDYKPPKKSSSSTKKKSGGPQSCPNCGKVLSDRKSLRNHMRKMHNEKLVQTFGCDKCPKSKKFMRTGGSKFTTLKFTFDKQYFNFSAEIAHHIHVSTMHPKVDPNNSDMVFCQLCDESSDKSFKPRAIESHIKLTHFAADMPTCKPFYYESL